MSKKKKALKKQTVTENSRKNLQMKEDFAIFAKIEQEDTRLIWKNVYGY